MVYISNQPKTTKPAQTISDNCNNINNSNNNNIVIMSVKLKTTLSLKQTHTHRRRYVEKKQIYTDNSTIKQNMGMCDGIFYSFRIFALF